MTRQKTHGLTLGKYAPLHKGHQLVIDTMIKEMDEVSVIIYDAPETTSTPLGIRINWLKTLYPQINLIEAWDGPTEVGYTTTIQQQHEDYILNTLQVSGITHFYSSEPYGHHMSQALGAVNRQIDLARQQVPISATAVRQNHYQQRHYLDPLVYRDLIIHVVFLGAPSSGKTTLAERMAQEYGTVWMPEYGRTYWETHQIGRRLTPNQLLEIAEGHLEREEDLLREANRYLFTDTNALTTYMFSQAYHSTAVPQLTQLAIQAQSRYDLTFLCDIDIPYDNTWDRSGDTQRQIFQKQIRGDLQQRRLPYFTLSGDLDTRVAKVKAVLQRFQKYRPITELQ